MEMASQYPQAQIFGADIRVPPEQPNFKNLKFLEMDIHQPWPLSDNSVDFVFQRNMGHFIQKDQWPFVLREMLRVLKPNGYIELVEPDLWHHNPGPVLQAFDQFFQNLCNTDLHIDYAFTETLKDQVEAVGFVDIEQRTLDIPIGEWPQEPELKQFGFINKETQKALLKNRRQFYMTKWNLSSEDYDTAVVEVLEEFEEYRGFQRFNCWIARKAPQNVS
ncbi:S-adenosyl-L-methionine-dependent methyltransferase [Radiomyces spectabilis]|uniref:S-adenosyl-L-methionine-dependent methyltransferase n=1 Tax=Radiomyces spectabilis TaxID=64574 RepID=UPI0022212827|nr:S-adenosyl-L-methionine-dependent methyltransferase [Radiomyces spectabilis]KAI8369525.1 S-adenosyl-L-methionine-dependent methyltransferase [Radiomyces spectabilis]